MKNKKLLIAMMLSIIIGAAVILAIGHNNETTEPAESEAVAKIQPVGPTFNADSALAFCQAQCDFGPRTMNSEAHEKCAQWIADKFRQYGMQVITQKADLTGYDGTTLHSTNIIASYHPERTDRILICAHWDSRPWADNDPDSANWHKPVMAANDGASGVAVMLEIARLINANENSNENVALGIDFICFDAEDWGTPQWSDAPSDADTWALGAQYWATHLHKEGYQARFGILLDMVGGQGARFFKESYSKQYAPDVVRKVWKAAKAVGYESFFPDRDGGGVTDDHVPVNEKANIPTIDIISCYPDCPQSSFGPTWHTVSDDMDHLDRTTLQAVGQTLIQVIFDN